MLHHGFDLFAFAHIGAVVDRFDVVGVFKAYAERFDFGGIAKSVQNQVNAFFCEALCDSEANSAR